MTDYMRNFVWCAGILVLTAPVSLLANEDEFDDFDLARFLIPPVFTVLDCTNEGYVQAAEVDEHLGELHQRYPMTLRYHLYQMSSLEPGRKEMLAKLDQVARQKIDSNGDSVVSRTEYRTFLIQLLERVDLDGDGEVSREDLAPSE
ncbi:MAG: hypothetical protein AAFV47_06045 [Pseudomonadota bacterium]